MAAQASKSKFVPVLLISGTFLIINATLPVRAQEIAYNITLTFNEPMTQPGNSVFVGSFDYNASTHAVTDLQGLLSEAMTDQGSGENWLTLNNQLPNGNSSQQYQWQVNQFTPYAGTSSQNDDTTGGTFATVFLNNSSSTFATSYNGATGDGWSPAGGIAVNWK
jgi:hypothetical protein